MIKKWYEVSCDLCGNGLNHYAELKPTCTDLREMVLKLKSKTERCLFFVKSAMKR